MFMTGYIAKFESTGSEGVSFSIPFSSHEDLTETNQALVREAAERLNMQVTFDSAVIHIGQPLGRELDHQLDQLVIQEYNRRVAEHYA